MNTAMSDALKKALSEKASNLISEKKETSKFLSEDKSKTKETIEDADVKDKTDTAVFKRTKLGSVTP